MFVSWNSRRTIFRLAAIGGGVSAFAAGFASASAGPRVSTSHGCYAVNQPVRLSGSGFAALSDFTVTIDGVWFGETTTDANGAFSTSLRPGGLPANIVQVVDDLEASDGTSTAAATFTVTRSTGARFLANGGNPHTLMAPFQVWDFGGGHSVYLHYVGPGGGVQTTVRLGRAGGQCGYLLTGSRRVFPFAPTVGNWTLQLDTHSGYSGNPSGPVSRIRVRIS